MAHTDVRIGLLGVMLGVLLGAGTVFHAETVAGSVVSFRQIENPRTASKRAVSERVKAASESRPSADATAESAADDSSAAPAREPRSMGECDIVVRTADELRAVILNVLPQGRDLSLRATVERAFDAYAADCEARILERDAEPQSSETLKPAASNANELDCSVLSGVRRKRCVDRMQ